MKEVYQNPLVERYASREMANIFSPDVQFRTWRTLWIALAEAEKELGLNITQTQIDQMKEFRDNINYEEAEKREKEVRHDVMAHIHAYGIQCPDAKPVIHLGATSAYVKDNTDIIVMKQALILVRNKLANLISGLADFAEEYKDLPTLGFTHFQPAQLTTVGKRATLWIQDFYFDLLDVEREIEDIMFLGVKGTTGTQASFMSLFNDDSDKVKALDRLVAEKIGFNGSIPVSGQTYTRKIDFKVLSVLSGIAQSASKMTNDIRMLQSLKEVEEPFGKKQIGSSAMAYKRNPMRSERIASLSRYVINNINNTAMTTATQWFERTLDDSANKRIVVPESFLAIDAVLDICTNVTNGLVVYDKVIREHVMSEIPFMATENIIMEAVKKGGDRQELHEHIRVHSMEAGKQVKMYGLRNDLLDRIADDEIFGLTREDVEKLVTPEDYTGRSSQQVVEFIEEYVQPIRDKYSDVLGADVDLKV